MVLILFPNPLKVWWQRSSSIILLEINWITSTTQPVCIQDWPLNGDCSAPKQTYWCSSSIFISNFCTLLIIHSCRMNYHHNLVAGCFYNWLCSCICNRDLIIYWYRDSHRFPPKFVISISSELTLISKSLSCRLTWSLFQWFLHRGSYTQSYKFAVFSLHLKNVVETY